jgi:hypothetical protein
MGKLASVSETFVHRSDFQLTLFLILTVQYHWGVEIVSIDESGTMDQCEAAY